MDQEQAALNILFTDDREIHELNLRFRKKDKPTDVLSFPVDSSYSAAISPSFIGELIISVDTAKRQAVEFEVSFRDEINRLLTHGLLHLLGYDHEGVTRAEAERMRRMERRLLNQL